MTKISKTAVLKTTVSKAATVSCPHCDKPVVWVEASSWRPFCSERCKLIDLGAWASEEYSVASETPSPMDDLDYSESLKN